MTTNLELGVLRVSPAEQVPVAVQGEDAVAGRRQLDYLPPRNVSLNGARVALVVVVALPSLPVGAPAAAQDLPRLFQQKAVFENRKKKKKKRGIQQ